MQPPTYQGPVTDYNDDTINYRSGLSNAVTDRGIRLAPAGKPMVDKRYSGYVLPSFDYYNMLRADTAFAESHVPCWNVNQADGKNAVHYSATGWAIKLPFYLYHGPRGEHIISNRAMLIPGLIVNVPELGPLGMQDAFWDLQDYIWKDRKMSRGEKDMYLKKPSLDASPAVPNVGSVFAMNTIGSSTDYPDLANTVMLIKPSAHEYVLQQMRWHAYADREEKFQPLDPKFPNYVLGDVTDPARALSFYVQKVNINDRTVNTPVFSEQVNCRPRDVRPLALTAEMLRNRVDFTDYNSWNWMPYHEQVEMILESYMVPIELIRQALGARATIPARGRFESSTTTTSHPGMTPGGAMVHFGPPVMSAIPGMMPQAPVQQAPVSVPQAPAPVPQAPVQQVPAPQVPVAPPVAPVQSLPKLWVGVPGQDSKELTRPEMEALRLTTPNAMVLSDAASGTWENLDEYLGPVAVTPTVPTVPNTADIWQAAAAAVPVAPSVPQAPAAPAAGGADVEAALTMTFGGTLSNLTPAEQSEARTLMQTIQAAQATGASIPSEISGKLLALVSKAASGNAG